MKKKAQPIDADAAQEEVVYEPAAELSLDRAMGLVPESLQRRQPERTIR